MENNETKLASTEIVDDQKPHDYLDDRETEKRWQHNMLHELRKQSLFLEQILFLMSEQRDHH
jgi:hypothetical protein